LRLSLETVSIKQLHKILLYFLCICSYGDDVDDHDDDEVEYLAKIAKVG